VTGEKAPAAWHPYCVALYPVFFLWGWNIREVDPAEVLAPVAVLVALTFLLSLLAGKICRVPDAAAAAVSGIWLGCFCYGPLRDHFRPADRGLALLIGDAVFLLLFLTVAIRVRVPLPNVTRILNAVSAILVVLAVAQVAGAMPERLAAYENNARATMLPAVSRPETRLPDIYYVILDGYGREDVLLSRYGVDNAPFLDALRKRGFRVLNKSRSNYIITLTSLASALNMEHAADLDLEEPIIAELRLVRNSVLEETLRSLGYATMAISSGRMNSELGGFDRLVTPGRFPSSLEGFLMNMTPLVLPLENDGWLYRRHGDNLIEALEHFAEPRPEHPVFALVHIFAPHPPFVFDRAGRRVHPRRPLMFFDGSHFLEYVGSREEYVRGYGEQLRFINDRLIAAIDTILARPGPRPIIILQGDHGPAARLDWTSIANTDLVERAGILNAWLAPASLQNALPDTLTPVNGFRYLLNDLASADLAMLPDSSYYSSWQTGFHAFVDITDRVK
jgi:hypothetical protein